MKTPGPEERLLFRISPISVSHRLPIFSLSVSLFLLSFFFCLNVQTYAVYRTSTNVQVRIFRSIHTSIEQFIAYDRIRRDDHDLNNIRFRNNSLQVGSKMNQRAVSKVMMRGMREGK